MRRLFAVHRNSCHPFACRDYVPLQAASGQAFGRPRGATTFQRVRHIDEGAMRSASPQRGQAANVPPRSWDQLFIEKIYRRRLLGGCDRRVITVVENGHLGYSRDGTLNMNDLSARELAYDVFADTLCSPICGRFSVVRPSNSSSFDSASFFVALTMPSLWCGGEYIVYSFRASVLDVLITLCAAPRGTITASSFLISYSLPSITHFPLPRSTRKN